MSNGSGDTDSTHYCSLGSELQDVNLGTGKTAKKISTGLEYACAILNDDTVKCWGKNDYKQLGYGDTENRGDATNEMGYNLPTVNLGQGRTAVDIKADDSRTCAILDNNTVKCWGKWPYENGVIIDFGGEPISVATGGSVNCVVMQDQSLKCWGYSEFGQLGQGNTEYVSYDNPVQINLGTGKKVGSIAMSQNHICALLTDNTIKCWGANAHGQLGYGDIENRGDEPNEMGTNLPYVDIGVP